MNMILNNNDDIEVLIFPKIIKMNKKKGYCFWVDQIMFIKEIYLTHQKIENEQKLNSSLSRMIKIDYDNS